MIDASNDIADVILPWCRIVACVAGIQSGKSTEIMKKLWIS